MIWGLEMGSRNGFGDTKKPPIEWLSFFVILLVQFCLSIILFWDNPVLLCHLLFQKGRLVQVGSVSWWFLASRRWQLVCPRIKNNVCQTQTNISILFNISKTCVAVWLEKVDWWGSNVSETRSIISSSFIRSRICVFLLAYCSLGYYA